MGQVPAVGGITQWIDVGVTCSTSVYASGDVVGGLLTIPLDPALDANSQDAARTGVIQAAILSDADGEAVNADLLLFSADPSAGSTLTDNAAIVLSAAALEAVMGVVSFSAWTDVGADAVATAQNVGLPYQSDASANMFGVLVSRGAPTYTSVDDLNIRLGVLED